MPPPQPVNEPRFSVNENRGSSAKSDRKYENGVRKEAFPAPNCQLFQIHGSKLQPHPGSNPSQASMVCISHAVFFFCVCKDSFNGLLALRISLLSVPVEIACRKHSSLWQNGGGVQQAIAEKPAIGQCVIDPLICSMVSPPLPLLHRKRGRCGTFLTG